MSPSYSPRSQHNQPAPAGHHHNQHSQQHYPTPHQPPNGGVAGGESEQWQRNQQQHQPSHPHYPSKGSAPSKHPGHQSGVRISDAFLQGTVAPSSGMLPGLSNKLADVCHEFSFDEIERATRGFSNTLGRGANGCVYKGQLPCGTDVAIKELQTEEGGFEEEVRVLSKFRHPHLVTLLGYARSKYNKYLVYEFLPNGDVSNRLQNCHETPFPWTLRVKVIHDALKGLAHLHGLRPKVFHRDIKTANILVDDSNKGKLADFGLACRAQRQTNTRFVDRAKGTPGYADPSYIETRMVTEAAEIFSFGMVLLEVLTARPPAVYVSQASNELSYLIHELDLRDHKSAVRLVDQRAQYPPQIQEQLSSLAFRCIRSESGGVKRPSCVEVVEEMGPIVAHATSLSWPVHSTPPHHAHQMMPAGNYQQQGYQYNPNDPSNSAWGNEWSNHHQAPQPPAGGSQYRKSQSPHPPAAGHVSSAYDEAGGYRQRDDTCGGVGVGGRPVLSTVQSTGGRSVLNSDTSLPLEPHTGVGGVSPNKNMAGEGEWGTSYPPNGANESYQTTMDKTGIRTIDSSPHTSFPNPGHWLASLTCLDPSGCEINPEYNLNVFTVEEVQNAVNHFLPTIQHSKPGTVLSFVVKSYGREQQIKSLYRQVLPRDTYQQISRTHFQIEAQLSLHATEPPFTRQGEGSSPSTPTMHPVKHRVVLTLKLNCLSQNGAQVNSVSLSSGQFIELRPCDVVRIPCCVTRQDGAPSPSHEEVEQSVQLCFVLTLSPEAEAFFASLGIEGPTTAFGADTTDEPEDSLGKGAEDEVFEENLETVENDMGAISRNANVIHGG
eukprot:GHVN01094190.1.p1 GENE.GHVN01094190.1~~GHVN01094190.1.p1  ORF type:complete len:828 (-),score=117.77 GHVN01094190.1:178-2661(-)